MIYSHLVVLAGCSLDITQSLLLLKLLKNITCFKAIVIHLHVCIINISSDAPIIRSVIGIGHYWPLFQYWYQLFLNNVTDIVKSVPTMSFLVIVTSLIACMIYIIIEKMFVFIKRIRNQKVDRILDCYQYISKVIICLSEYAVQSLIGASLIIRDSLQI